MPIPNWWYDDLRAFIHKKQGNELEAKYWEGHRDGRKAQECSNIVALILALTITTATWLILKAPL